MDKENKSDEQGEEKRLSQHPNISDDMIKEAFDIYIKKYPHFNTEGAKENWCNGAVYMREWFIKALLRFSEEMATSCKP